jgi:hypothetical protein
MLPHLLDDCLMYVISSNLVRLAVVVNWTMPVEDHTRHFKINALLSFRARAVLLAESKAVHSEGQPRSMGFSSRSYHNSTLYLWSDKVFPRP